MRRVTTYVSSQIPESRLSKPFHWLIFGTALVLTFLMPTPAEAGCSMNVGKVTDNSIEIHYDSTSCKKSCSGVTLCLKKAWEAVGACNGGTTVDLSGKKGSHTFTNLAPATAYKIKARHCKRNLVGWAKFGKTTTSTRSHIVSQLGCGEISHPTLFDYTGDSVRVAFQSAGGSCNPTAFLVQAKYWYQRWLDAVLFNTGAGQFGTNHLVVKGIVEGLVALGIVPEENKDEVMEKLKSIQGTGHKYVALAGNGKNHEIQLGGLSDKRRYYVRVFAVDPDGNLSSYKAHTVKTPSKGIFKREGSEVEWTEWLDRDGPGGKGDYETTKDFVALARTCQTPLAIECRAKDGRDWRQVGQTYRCEPEVGGVCINAKQTATVPSQPRDTPTRSAIAFRRAPERQRRFLGSPASCLDYEVRFLCPSP